MKAQALLRMAMAIGLLISVAPGTAAAAAPSAGQVVQVTMIATLCPSYTVVPANRTPTNLDQTGGHGAELDGTYQKVLVNPGTDIPGVCRPADGWQFQLFGDPGLSTAVGSPLTTGAGGVGTGAITVTLDPTEIALAQTLGAPTGLWVAEITQPGVAGFGALRCFNDMNNGDNAENIQGIGASSLHIYCISYNVLPPATYHPLTPARILDTRSGSGGLSGPFKSHVARTFQVAGKGGVLGSAIAVTGNLTVTRQNSRGYLFVGPVARNNPASSTLNFPMGDDRANAVTVALGAGGTLSVTFVGTTAGKTADVLFDVTGYFTPDATGATYHALSPARVLDTRTGTGGITGAFVAHVAQTFQLAGDGGVGLSATAVTGNVTVTQQTSRGFLFVGPVASNNPTSSTLNFPVKDSRANAVTVALGGGGTLSTTYVASSPTATAQVIFDVSGFFTPDATGASFVPVGPTRVLDTRTGTGGLLGRFTSHSARTFTVGGHADVPANAIAVTGNLTVTGQTRGGYLFIGPLAANNPTSSTLNFPVGDDRANAVTVALGAGGTLSITYVASSPSATTQVVFDVTGYYVP
jgi:hypothetical protein